MTLPVPSQRTWTVGDIVTAAEMNANVRDAVNFLANVPLFIGNQTSTQTLASSGFIGLTFDGSLVDTYGGHSTSVNNTRYTAQVAGYYLVSVQTEFATNATGLRALQIWVNGSAPTPIPTVQQAAGASPSGLHTSAVLSLAAGSYVEARADQNSGGSLALTTNRTMICVSWLHA